MRRTIRVLKELRTGLAGGLRRLSAGARPGVTLTELMVAMAILTIGVIGLTQTFIYIQKAVQLSKNRTLASNLAQEKMQILKQKTYYQVLVTTDPVYNTTDFSPEFIMYDAGYFPPEQITEGGVSYTRYTYVESLREDSGLLAKLDSNLPDVGMKRITITVVWGYGVGGKRKVTLRSVLTNPDTIMSNVVFNGTIKSTSAEDIGGALVSLVQASSYGDTTSPSGKYIINATPGTYTLLVSATGYFTAMKNAVATSGETTTTDFTLVKKDAGIISGYPWVNDHLVISQVVGSTAAPSGYDQEYVEVFNPTTYTWLMNGAVGLNFRRAVDPSKKAVQISYTTSEILSNSYYLFANLAAVTVGGAIITPDAVWSPANTTVDFPYFGTDKNVIPVFDDDAPATVEGSGALELYRVSDGMVLDRVGWNRSGYPAPFSEGAAIVQTTGLEHGELYARITSTSDVGGVSASYGPAYDSNNNSVDFYRYTSAGSLSPHSSYSGSKTVISGTPAAGAMVSCTDGLSASTQAALSSTTPPYAHFSLVNVATGSWTVFIASATNSLPSLQSAVTISSSGAVATLASASTFLTAYQDSGFVTGRVQTALGVPIKDIKITSGGSNTATTGLDGTYMLPVSPGITDITANPSGAGNIASYVTDSSNTINITAGAVNSGVDFTLYEGGRVRGYITRGNNEPLPNVAVAILDANSVARDQQVSGNDGRFTSVILSTGLYTVYPALGSLESSSPASSTVTISAMGTTYFSSSFTISGAMGYVTGTVRSKGQPIKSGVLILVTTTTFTNPPDLSSTTLTGPPYYMVSSGEDGLYTAEVRGSSVATYKVYAYFQTPSGTSVTISSGVVSNVDVAAGATHTGVDFSW